MALYEITTDGLQIIPLSSFQDKQIRERDDLQKYLKTEISVLSPDLLVIAEEFGDWDDSRRRIDLLAIDKDANLVVIELKRTTDGGHMELQAVRYAAMVSTMTFQQACATFQTFLIRSNINSDAKKTILEFLDWNEPDEGEFNNDVRILLVSSDFSKEVTTAVMWLNDRGLDIRCYRMIPHDLEGRTLVDIQQIIPLPEVEDFQIKVSKKSQAARTARSQKIKWDMERLLKTIRSNTSDEVASVAEMLFTWCSKNMNRIWWSDAKIDGSFIPVWDSPQNKGHIFIAVRSIGKIEVHLGEMAKKAPFDKLGLREEFIHQLNEVGANIPHEKSSHYPKFPMELLVNKENFEKFTNTLLWALKEVQSVE